MEIKYSETASLFSKPLFFYNIYKTILYFWFDILKKNIILAPDFFFKIKKIINF